VVADNVSPVPAADEGGEEAPLSAAEEKAEALLLAATRAWNVEGRKPAALKLAKQSVELLEAEGGRAKQLAEAYATLADMYFATEALGEAEATVHKAMTAAEGSGQYALAVKLSNNLGAVMKKQNKLPEVLELHSRTWNNAVTHLGLAHPFAQLARSNVVETLDELGRRDEARAFLDESLGALVAEEGSKVEALRAEGGDPDAPLVRPKGDEGEASAAGAEENAEQGPNAAEGTWAQQPGETKASAAVRLVRSALVRTYMEKGRLEMRREAWGDAEGAMRAALTLCERVYGQGSAESGSPMYALATCLRGAGRREEAAEVFNKLYDITLATQGAKSENAVGVARQLYELHDEAGRLTEAARMAEAALQSMQLLMGLKVHPYLEPHFMLAVKAKTKAGDMAGAEALKRAFLKGMAQLSAMQQRSGGRGGGRQAPPKRR